MDIDARFSLLREKLNGLGFTQPLPIGSLAIVSALLDDLILTNKNLKDAKNKISKLEKEKIAWCLSIEPYKCDNSKLLSECNSLNLDIIRQREDFQHRIFELNKKIRGLDCENRDLKQKCIELSAKIDELDPRQRKNRNDLLNQKRRPFISTVRSGEFLPITSKSIENMNTQTKCHCQGEKNDSFSQLIAEQEANKVKTHLELVELYKSQIESRNREISRLNQLLAGGRPIAALAKDCCYKDISTLVDDLNRLQRTKSECESNYEQAMKELARLSNENENLSKELMDIRNIALGVESEANLSIDVLHKRNSLLKIKLIESKKRIVELESQLNPYNESSVVNIKLANKQIKCLQEGLQRATHKESELKTEVEKLFNKNAKLKEKLSTECHKCNLSQEARTNDVCTMTTMDFDNFAIDANRLKIDRDFYQQEYLKLLNQPLVESENNLLQKQLIEKDYTIKSLLKQLEVNHTVNEASPPCRSVEITIHRLERENKQLHDTVNRLKLECKELTENIQLNAGTQRDQIDRNECKIEQLIQQIQQLKIENQSLKTIDATAKTTNVVLKDEIIHLKEQIVVLNKENTKLQTSSKYLQTLQEQTENSLIDYQNLLTNCEREKHKVESRLNIIDSNRSEDLREVSELRAEINRLKILNTKLVREKDKLICDLDAKAEEIFQLEPKMESMKKRILELESELSAIHHEMNNISSDNKYSKSSLEQVTNDMMELKRQINQLKTSKENLKLENRRLTNDLAAFECNNIKFKTKLSESDKEIDRLKKQLQQYVQEVQRAEELLHRKEEERNEMLEQYRTLSHDAVALEGTNQCLELEAAESKRHLIEMEGKLTQLQIQLTEKECEIDSSNARILDLTKKNTQLELDIQRYIRERNSVQKELKGEKELCSKLDIEIEKLYAEVNEYSKIRQELDHEIAKLRNELTSTKKATNASADNLQKLLCGTRKELENERINSSHLKGDIETLRARIDELKVNIAAVHENAACQENLAKEYDSTIKNLRNDLADTRFDRSQS